ncbi:MAG TPA: hypothetical protein DF712_02430 [Balneola sp.]|jgi:photosystem II stability/assembly factor-like uncharacterized protein|nr:hypothetical protein [Bacteroidota bacterium]HCT51293.1 hypothetical protein [Balneola sp.]|tara:strand:+ start:367 stop:1395 length:1029 start_codon:yes stop_codon:yes gene_type:complete
MRTILFVVSFLLLLSCGIQTGEIPFDTWQEITPNKEAFYGKVFFISETHGWMLGTTRCVDSEDCTGWGSRVYSTTNSGNSWKETTISGTSHLLSGLYFFNSKRGIVSKASIWETQNGGESWEVKTPAFLGRRYSDFDFSSDSIGWAAGKTTNSNGAIITKTINGGATWNELTNTQNPDANYRAISSPSNQVLYAAGSQQISGSGFSGIIIKTENGGDSWEELSLPDDFPGILNDVEFIDESYGWVVSSFRTIYKTADGGDTWEKQNLKESSDAIYSIDAIDYSHAVAVTSDGAILVTKDGGANWEEQVEAGSYPQLGKVFYHKSGFAYATGNGIVLRARLSQ